MTVLERKVYYQDSSSDYSLAGVYLHCPLCGWWLAFDVHTNSADPWRLSVTVLDQRLSVLRQFDIDSPQLALKELGSHLRQNFSDVYRLSWRRFEELISDVFREHGFRTILTLPTRDGGADVLLLSNEGSRIYAIVECKKYAEGRTIGVSAVRTLVGAAVDFGIRRAYLVTSSRFSTDAQLKALDYKSRGYDIDLVAASELLTMLNVYDESLPPLDLLTTEQRSNIVMANRARSGRDAPQWDAHTDSISRVYRS